MRYKDAINGRNIMSFCFMLVGIYVIATAIPWPRRTGLFPLIMGIVFTGMFALELGLCIFSKTWGTKKKGGFDFKFAEGEIDAATVIKRTRESFAWIIAYFLLVHLIGFVYAIPVFFMLYFRIVGKESWKKSALVTGVAFALFYLTFVWGLGNTYPDSWVHQGLAALGIMK
jgi:Na+-transporting NADH:ubiquinone oxidoreductase subunit NqrB